MVQICSISPAQFEAAKAQAAEEATRKAALKAQAENEDAQALATVVPARVLAAYESCGGDPDNLPDDIDNPMYWELKRYAKAIEMQRLATATSLLRRADQSRS